MGNTSSASQYHQVNSHWELTASNILLDQMENQTCVVAMPTWMETAMSHCVFVLALVTAMLMGNFTGSLNQAKKTPALIDAACQTEDEVFVVLAANRNWQSCHVDNKEANDDDSNSCTTEMSEMFTDTESEDDERDFGDDDLEWGNVESTAEDALRDACESCADCDCETQIEQLLHMTATICVENDDSIPIYLEDYLCTCGECPQYNAVADDVAVAVKTSKSQRQSITRLLQSFSTYNEVIGYNASMIPVARECLRIWCGDENKAFQSFVTLYDEVPRQCDPACCD